jgi:Protein of unknown function (DUF1638)
MDLAPTEPFEFRRGSENAKVLLIACGALAREIIDLIERNRWPHFDLICLPAIWHMTPNKIAPGVRERIRAAKGRYQRILVLYGDCGTGGELDKVLAEEGGIERIEGPHCYAFFSGNRAFEARGDQDMTAFFLTDYLVRQFDKVIWRPLGLDRHPELLKDYFGNYTKLVYLAQVPDPKLEEKAREAAHRLGLTYEHRATGYGDLAGALMKRSDSEASHPSTTS